MPLSPPRLHSRSAGLTGADCYCALCAEGVGLVAWECALVPKLKAIVDLCAAGGRADCRRWVIDVRVDWAFIGFE
jgi:hypothetical protein